MTRHQRLKARAVAERTCIQSGCRNPPEDDCLKCALCRERANNSTRRSMQNKRTRPQLLFTFPTSVDSY